MANLDLTQVIGLFNLAMTSVAKYRASRQAFKDANPGEAAALPDEDQLFELLKLDGQKLQTHAAAVITKYGG